MSDVDTGFVKNATSPSFFPFSFASLLGVDAERTGNVADQPNSKLTPSARRTATPSRKNRQDGTYAPTHVIFFVSTAYLFYARTAMTRAKLASLMSVQLINLMQHLNQKTSVGVTTRPTSSSHCSDGCERRLCQTTDLDVIGGDFNTAAFGSGFVDDPFPNADFRPLVFYPLRHWWLGQCLQAVRAERVPKSGVFTMHHLGEIVFCCLSRGSVQSRALSFADFDMASLVIVIMFTAGARHAYTGSVVKMHSTEHKGVRVTVYVFLAFERST